MKTQNGTSQSDLTAFLLGKTSSVTFKTIIGGQQCSVTITRP